VQLVADLEEMVERTRGELGATGEYGRRNCVRVTEALVAPAASRE
jgi:hypothetical protein